MPQGDAVRHVVRLNGRRRRSLEERLLVRMPILVRLTSPALTRLSPRSRLRGALVTRRTRQIYEAFNRGDTDVFLLLGSHPDVEMHTDQKGGVGIDLQDTYRGHRGLLAFRQDWLDAFGAFRVELDELIDCGDTLVVLMRLLGKGQSSGAEVEHALGMLITLGDMGPAVRIDNFWSQEEALQAVGLSE